MRRRGLGIRRHFLSSIFSRIPEVSKSREFAESSVSQEDFDVENEATSRTCRSKIRLNRSSRVATTTCNNRSPADGQVLQLMATTTTSGDEQFAFNNASGPTSTSDSKVMTTTTSATGTSAVEHDTSPKPTSRMKDKSSRSRPNHINKGKQQRDRRKLREKRRSTGVVHLPSTESTGGSTGDDDDCLLSAETKKNTMFNEILDKDKNANHSVEGRMPRTFHRRNKSPSDLDADDEDNQDYDSTVNQSDSMMSLQQEAVASSVVVVASGGGGRRRATSNGRPDTPETESLEELLERAREENNNLLELLAEKDRKINSLQEEVNKLQKLLHSGSLENDKLKEENTALLRAMAQLHV